MGHINVTINGRQYRMACEDGQEDRLITLARELETRIERLRGSFGEIGDQRLTVMAAIQVADELEEAYRRLVVAEAEVKKLREARAHAAVQTEAAERETADLLHAAAQRIERLAHTIAGGGPRRAGRALTGFTGTAATPRRRLAKPSTAPTSTIAAASAAPACWRLLRCCRRAPDCPLQSRTSSSSTW